MPRSDGSSLQRDELFEAERRSLVRLCAHLTGEPQAAEDLAQETLLIACRQEDALRAPHLRRQWLAGIARNLCRAWSRGRSRESARLLPHIPNRVEGADALIDFLSGGLDVELEWERAELASLLNRALSKLSPDARNVLVLRYIEDLPQAEVAARLRLSQGAVAMRAHRSKLELRRILIRDFHLEIAAYRPLLRDDTGSQETRIWCPVCGARRLTVAIEVDHRRIIFRCPRCCCEPEDSLFETDLTDDLRALRNHRSILSRHMRACYDAIAPALTVPGASCLRCGGPLSVERYRREERFLPWGGHGANVSCPACETSTHTTLLGLTLDLPVAQRFWREHARIRTLPERDVTVGGRPALLVTLESVRNPAALDVLSAVDTYEVLQISPRVR